MTPSGDEHILVSAEVSRWISGLADDDYGLTGAHLAHAYDRFGEPDEDSPREQSVIVALDATHRRLRGLVVPARPAPRLLTFYTVKGPPLLLVMLTVCPHQGGNAPAEMQRARRAMLRAQAAGDDPSVLRPPPKGARRL